jgi:hypothetical protein
MRRIDYRAITVPSGDGRGFRTCELIEVGRLAHHTSLNTHSFTQTGLLLLRKVRDVPGVLLNKMGGYFCGHFSTSISDLVFVGYLENQAQQIELHLRASEMEGVRYQNQRRIFTQAP